MTTTLDTARGAYLDAVRARLDADAAVVAAAVAWRRAERDCPVVLLYAEQEAWDAARLRRMDAARVEQTALHAYERELYAATYGYEGRP
jgi:hypothetical protein